MKIEDEIWQAMQSFPEQAKRSETLSEFAGNVGGIDVAKGKWLCYIAERNEDYWNRTFQTFKRCGYVAKTLAFPNARKVEDVFERVDLAEHKPGYSRYPGTCFLGCVGSRAPKDFGWFGRLGASYVRAGRPYLSGGAQYSTQAKWAPAVLEWWRANVGPIAGDYGPTNCEVIDWGERGILIAATFSTILGSRWIAILDKGQSALNMLSEHERGEIRAEEARKLEQRKEIAA